MPYRSTPCDTTGRFRCLCRHLIALLQLLLVAPPRAVAPLSVYSNWLSHLSRTDPPHPARPGTAPPGPAPPVRADVEATGEAVVMFESEIDAARRLCCVDLDVVLLAAS